MYNLLVVFDCPSVYGSIKYITLCKTNICDILFIGKVYSLTESFFGSMKFLPITNQGRGNSILGPFKKVFGHQDSGVQAIHRVLIQMVRCPQWDLVLDV